MNMCIRSFVRSHTGRALAIWCLSALAGALFTPVGSETPEDINISTRFDEVVSLRSQGEYAKAAEILRDILAEGMRAEDISRRAYNYLVITAWDAEDRESAIELAREALLLYPDLDADRIAFPPKLNALYEEVRAEIFGSLHVEADPESCEVFLDDEYLGKTPIELLYVPIGTYELVLKKHGHRDYSKTLSIKPGTEHRIEDIRLSAVRSWWWWAWRVGGAVAVLVGAGFIAAGSEEGGNGNPPLARPPDPPR
jgi:hypothetical protein